MSDAVAAAVEAMPVKTVLTVHPNARRFLAQGQPHCRNAVAEIFENAWDAGAKSFRIDIDDVPGHGGLRHRMRLTDDGDGLNTQEFSKLEQMGACGKDSTDLGGYGHGLRSSTARLIADTEEHGSVYLFSKGSSSITVCELWHPDGGDEEIPDATASGAPDVLAPRKTIPCHTAGVLEDNGVYTPLPRDTDALKSIWAHVQLHGDYSSQDEFLREFAEIEETGFKVVILGLTKSLHKTATGDIVEGDEQTFKDMYKKDVSLSDYLSVKYSESAAMQALRPRPQIWVAGAKVLAHNFDMELWEVEKIEKLGSFSEELYRASGGDNNELINSMADALANVTLVLGYSTRVAQAFTRLGPNEDVPTQLGRRVTKHRPDTVPHGICFSVGGRLVQDHVEPLGQEPHRSETGMARRLSAGCLVTAVCEVDKILVPNANKTAFDLTSKAKENAMKSILSAAIVEYAWKKRNKLGSYKLDAGKPWEHNKSGCRKKPRPILFVKTPAQAAAAAAAPPPQPEGEEDVDSIDEADGVGDLAGMAGISPARSERKRNSPKRYTPANAGGTSRPAKRRKKPAAAGGGAGGGGGGAAAAAAAASGASAAGAGGSFAAKKRRSAELQRDIDRLHKEKQSLCDEIDEEIKTKTQQKQNVERELEENLKMIRKLERDISQARKTKECAEKQRQTVNGAIMRASALDDFRAASKEMEGVWTQLDKATKALSRLEEQLQEIQAR